MSDETIHRVLLDVDYDAARAGLCRCGACRDGYVERYEEALIAEARERGLRVELELGSCMGPNQTECDPSCAGECHGLWQATHDSSADWRRSDDCELHGWLNGLEEAYAAATGEWTGCDWRHKVECGTCEGRGWDHGLDEPCPDCDQGHVYCEGGMDDCDYCGRVVSSASDAEAYAAAAMECARAYDLRGALDLADQAAREECHWGDDPTWGDLAQQIRAAAEQLDEVAHRDACGIDRQHIRALRSEAESAGDDSQVALCETALRDGAGPAWDECLRVIADARAAAR